MPGFSESSVSLRVSLPLSAVAFLLIVIGVSTPYWDDDKIGTSHFGLWTVCVNLAEISKCMSVVDNYQLTGGIPEWYKAVQALEVIGTLLAFGALVLIVLCLFVDYVGRNKFPHLIAMFTCFSTALCVIIGIIIWAAKWNEELKKSGVSNPVKYLSWSFALCIVGAGFSCLTGIFMIFNLQKRWYM